MADHFRCERYACLLTVQACATRFRLANAKARKARGRGALPVLAGSACHGCPVGAGHAAQNVVSLQAQPRKARSSWNRLVARAARTNADNRLLRRVTPSAPQGRAVPVARAEQAGPRSSLRTAGTGTSSHGTGGA